jgi:copper chaperone CopZ
MKTLAMALAVTGALSLTAQGAFAQETPSTGDEAPVIEVTILGLACPFCAYGLQQKMQDLDGIDELEVDLEKGLATLTMSVGGDLSNEILLQTVKDAGFEVAKITRNYESEFLDYEADAGDE